MYLATYMDGRRHVQLTFLKNPPPTNPPIVLYFVFTPIAMVGLDLDLAVCEASVQDGKF